MAAPDIFPLAGTATLKESGMVQNRAEAYYTLVAPRDGLDMIFFAQPMNEQLKALEDKMIEIMDNANLSDVQKQFNLQQLMNSWSAISQGMTNMLKAVADVNRAVVRNIE